MKVVKPLKVFQMITIFFSCTLILVTNCRKNKNKKEEKAAATNSEQLSAKESAVQVNTESTKESAVQVNTESTVSLRERCVDF